MKNVIFTCSDARFGDFLVNHWYKSLKGNVDLSNTDVVVIDYGMTKKQLSKLKGAIIIKGVKDNHVTIIRYREMLRFLEKHRYNQVLSTDGGDVIFQDDIKKAFGENKNDIRVACEHFYFPFKEIYTKGFFSREDTEKIESLLKGKRMINVGVIFAPYKKFKTLCREFNRILVDKSRFGPEQVAINYILYKDGFKQIDERYNFVVASAKSRFFIKDGVFYFRNGERIAIVHNAGGISAFRPVKEFGYGKDRNKIRRIALFFLRIFYRTSYFVNTKILRR